MNTDKIKKSLLLCSEQKCNECLYNNWVKDVCQSHLLRDAAKLLETKKRNKIKGIEYPQIEFDFTGGNDYGN